MKKLFLTLGLLVTIFFSYTAKAEITTIYSETTSNGDSVLFDGSSTASNGRTLCFRTASNTNLSTVKFTPIFSPSIGDYTLRIYTTSDFNNCGTATTGTLFEESINQLPNSWTSGTAFTFNFSGTYLDANQIYQFALYRTDAPTLYSQINISHNNESGTKPQADEKLQLYSVSNSDWYLIKGEMLGGDVFGTRITAITSPTTQAQTNDVTFSANIFNGSILATQFCVKPSNNFQSVSISCTAITGSGSTSASLGYHFYNDGSYFATVSIIDANGRTIDSRSLTFYVNNPSFNFITPTSTEFGLDQDLFDLIDGWTCNIEFFSGGTWDPCAIFGDFVSDFLLVLWNGIVKLSTGFIYRPPFSYVGEIYTTINDINNDFDNASTSISDLNIYYKSSATSATSTITISTNQILTGVVPQSLWDMIRPFLELLLGLLFGFWLYHKVKKMMKGLNK